MLFQVVCTGGTVFLYHTSFCKTGPFFVRYRVPNLNKGSQVFLQGQWRLAAPGSPLLRLCQGAQEAQKITRRKYGTSKFRWTKTARGFLIPQDIFRTPGGLHCAFKKTAFYFKSVCIFLVPR